MWSLGSIAGSALGGFLAQPAKFYPHLFSSDGIFGQYPYLLPNLLSVAVCVIAIVQGIFFLEETHHPGSSVPTTEAQTYARVNNDPDNADETTSLITPKKRRESTTSAYSTATGGVTYFAESLPVPIDPVFDLRRGSLASLGSITLKSKPSIVRIVAQHSDNAIAEDGEEPTIKSEPIKPYTKGVIMWTVALIFQSYHSMGFGSLLPIYLLDDPHRKAGQLDLTGGLGMTLHDVGTYLAVSSLMSLFFQGVVFTFFVARLGVWKAVLVVTVLSPLIYIVVPFLSLLPLPEVGIYGVLALSSFTSVISFPSFLILLKNDTPSPSVLGEVNGLAMSACSAARTISPPLVGIFYSAFGSAGAWWSCGLVAMLGVIQFLFTARPKDDNEAILRKAETTVIDVQPAMADVGHT